MKKVLTLVTVASISLVACGPSAEDIAAAEKARQDSIQAYENIKKAEEAEREQIMQDSINVENYVEWINPLSVKLFPRQNWIPKSDYNINIFKKSKLKTSML